MTRYIEDVVANHQAASARRKAGKPIWDVKVPLQSLLNEAPDDISEQNAADIAHQIGRLLREKLPPEFLSVGNESYNGDIDELIGRFEEVSAENLKLLMQNENNDAADCLDVLLEELFDWADRYRVWLGN